MDLQSNLIESSKGRNGHGKGWKCSIASVGVHGFIIAFIVIMSATAVHPGHGPSTTLGAEIATNPFLAELRDEAHEVAG